jgi:hypothetical protein
MAVGVAIGVVDSSGFDDNRLFLEVAFSDVYLVVAGDSSGVSLPLQMDERTKLSLSL